MAAKPPSTHVLVFEAPPPSPSRLEEALLQAGYRVSHATTPEEVRDLTERDSTFAAVITNGTQGDARFAHALRELRHSNPHIPAIALNANGSAPELERLDVDHLAGDVDLGVVLDRLSARLSSHSYDDRLLEALALDTIDCLTTNVPDIAVRPDDCFLRYDARMLGQMTAMIDIMGEDLIGKIMLSGPVGWFELESRAVLGVEHPNRAMISDSAAELCNLLAGRVRTHYLRRGIDSAMGTPTVFGGSDVFVRVYSPRPSVVLSFTSDRVEGQMFAEWLLERKAPDRAGEEPEIEAGDLEFF